MGHNSVNHQNKSHKKPAKAKATEKPDCSNSIRHCGGKVGGEEVGLTMYQGDLTLHVDNHSEVALKGNTLHCWKGKDDYVINDAALVSRVQALKSLFDKGAEQQQLEQLKKLALEIEKAPGIRATH